MYDTRFETVNTFQIFCWMVDVFEANVLRNGELEAENWSKQEIKVTLIKSNQAAV